MATRRKRAFLSHGRRSAGVGDDHRNQSGIADLNTNTLVSNTPRSGGRRRWLSVRRLARRTEVPHERLEDRRREADHPGDELDVGAEAVVTTSSWRWSAGSRRLHPRLSGLPWRSPSAR